ncbi:glycosyltransferase family 4 protein [Rhodococcus opacus]|uniref:glycosyltransferase family 4 protein n=1 Tax=Rhodococcus opacus TaxID=37919 RepID=UPI0011C4480C|nr:glycosyltransferase family 1 protein [Rhodococcus opacus]QZS54637.1 glycosyltransferase family 4 protein [Rhodococcus opacus]UNN03465.1 glycosyltransferase family 4 protein [Rhodococcus opacus]UZG57374.1 glycosyltransferase family 4 protein [Rhodococcus opacus]
MTARTDMRVLLDGYWWVDGPPSGRLVLREAIGQWAQSYPGDELFLAVPAGRVDSARATVPDGVRVVPTRSRVHPLINSVELPFVARKIGNVDAVLAQNFSPVGSPSVVYVHDVLFQSNPEWFTRVERAYLSLIPRLARRAGSVVTSSGAERARIRSHNPEIGRVATSGLGVARGLLSAEPVPPPVVSAVAEFVLTVGRLNVRKNVQRIIDAGVGSGLITPEYPLVVVGEASGKNAPIPPSTRAAVEDGSVIFTGRLSDGELRWLYENCDYFCCLSLGEGFGLPPVEARAFGARVLVSDLDVFRETLGAHAAYVDPLDVERIAAAMAALAKAGPEHPRPRGPRESADNDWPEVIRVLREELRHVSHSIDGATR